MLGNEGLIYGAAAANKPPPRLPFCPWPQEKGEMRLWPSFPRGEGPSAVGLQNNSRGRAGQLAGDGPPPPPYCARTLGGGLKWEYRGESPVSTDVVHSAQSRERTASCPSRTALRRGMISGIRYGTQASHVLSPSAFPTQKLKITGQSLYNSLQLCKICLPAFFF